LHCIDTFVDKLSRGYERAVKPRFVDASEVFVFTCVFDRGVNLAGERLELVEKIVDIPCQLCKLAACFDVVLAVFKIAAFSLCDDVGRFGDGVARYLYLSVGIDGNGDIGYIEQKSHQMKFEKDRRDQKTQTYDRYMGVV